MDIVIKVPHIPEVGETILARNVKKFGGGKGANQAIASARIGGNVHMIARLGNDDIGRKLYSDLKTNFVNVDGILFDDNAQTGTAYIYVSDRGENNIVVHQSANNKLDIAQIVDNLELFDKADLCIMQLEIPMDVVEFVIGVCKEKGIKVILNPAPARYLSDEILKDVFILTPNETELSILTNMCTDTILDIEKASKHLLDMGTQNVITTMGEKGSLLVNRTEKHITEAVTVYPTDTTAAGDSFTGALAVALGEGKNIKEAIKFATYAAALTVTKEGAQSSLPLRDEIERFIGRRIPAI
jgi:ribokinase